MELRQWLRRLHDEIGMTSVFVTHDQEEAFELADEVVVIRDYRLIAGWERKPADLGISWRLETGYVFGRTVQYYDSDTPTAHPGNTFMVRAGAWY